MRRRTGGRGRDAVVTGIGLCLPGAGSPVFTADDLWQVASTGTSCLINNGVYYGGVNLPKQTFDEYIPDIPEFFSRHYTDAHRFGLMSLAQAGADAGLDVQRDLQEAAVLVGRGGVDANIDSYLAVMRADPATYPVAEALELFVAAEQSVTPSDVALVQGGLTRSKGANFTVSCGCASSALQIGNAQRMIAQGEADIAVVTGVDVFSVTLIRNIQRLLTGAQQAYDAMRSEDMPSLLPSFDALMRPYDRRADCINHGEGSATLVIESREHAFARGARLYGQVLSQTTTRDGLSNPLACEESGKALVSAVRRCLGDTWEISDVPYVHGGSDGNVVVTAFEANAIRELYGPAARELLMTSQEGCFGHNGAPAGCLGVALTLLMMNHGQVCPTANCEEPADGLTFDPVPGTTPRALDFDYALSFNYQVGGVKSAILLGSPDV
ncbi:MULTISPECIES: beta-ketoacyl synthase N-terminal-like domain-containing protein [Streptomyces]|uniref:beta-ketoacyl synthase N-terminal-like domain-containing protein n=1 Tax=Streptomyces TaxID=1883 RepID=UPI00109CF86F|nr:MULTISPECIES: beta-ketoacyl synthase N-terminal-like domain-containing protein [unclassified Streptomyces]MCE3032009.1 ketoacyl synthase [Streptomyces sp. CMSTAAHL-2]TGZ17182.1 3-oxoacyl-[acyl-carrier-protein] synthase 1 KasA [Streptomyces sp. S816]